MHYKMLDTLTDGGNRVANLCHRGSAKTTLMGQYLILYIAVYGDLPGLGEVIYALYVSDSMDNGVKKMRLRLEQTWDNSDFLKEFIPTTKFTDVRWYFKNADDKEFVVTGHGAKTGVRGTVELGSRPQLALLDDLISDEDARSPTVISSVEDTVYKAITYALHPKRNLIIWSGTPFNSRDPLYKAVESGAWKVNVFPIAQTFPVDKEDFRGSWEDRFTYEYVLDNYNTALKLGKVSAFNQELMLRIMSDEDRLVQDSDIQWYDLSLIVKNKSAYNFYITTDFATSERTHADYTVISVWAYNNNGDWFWVDGVCKLQLMDATIRDLFRLVSIYKPQQVGIEINGQQKGFVSWIQSEMINKNCFFNLASDKNSKEPGLRRVTDKMTVFNTVVPWFKSHKIYFPLSKKEEKPMQEMYMELSLASPSGFKSKHDDFIDTISMLQFLTAWKPSEAIPAHQNDNGIWEPEQEEGKVSHLNSYIV